jgi:hypothetical protein
MVIASSKSATFVPGRARRCQCETPWRSEDTCVRCGRAVPGMPVVPAGEQPTVRGAHRWTRAGVLRALRTYKFFVGRAATPTDWSFEDDSDWPSVKTVMSLFGSFDVAVAAAGVLEAPRAS